MAVQSTGSRAAPGRTTTGPDRTTARDPLVAQDAATARALAMLGLAALGGAAILIGVLHLLPLTAGISSVRQTISSTRSPTWAGCSTLP